MRIDYFSWFIHLFYGSGVRTITVPRNRPVLTTPIAPACDNAAASAAPALPARPAKPRLVFVR